jgi:hypothetical protein
MKQEGRQILHFIATDEEEKERYRKEIRGLVGKQRNTVQFVVTDPTAGLEGLPVISDGEGYGLVLEDTRTGELHRYGNKDHKITSEGVESFLKDVHGAPAVQDQPTVTEKETKQEDANQGKEPAHEEEKAQKYGMVHEEL